MSKGWIGIDLDGTLAEYHSFKGLDHVGAPIPAMVERVKRWLAEGHEIRIFTARVSEGSGYVGGVDIPERNPEIARAAIEAWCQEHLGVVLAITNVKDTMMDELYDDRVVQVEKNTGRLLGYSTRGLSGFVPSSD